MQNLILKELSTDLILDMSWFISYRCFVVMNYT